MAVREGREAPDRPTGKVLFADLVDDFTAALVVKGTSQMWADRVNAELRRLIARHALRHPGGVDVERRQPTWRATARPGRRRASGARLVVLGPHPQQMGGLPPRVRQLAPQDEAGDGQPVRRAADRERRGGPPAAAAADRRRGVRPPAHRRPRLRRGGAGAERPGPGDAPPARRVHRVAGRGAAAAHPGGVHLGGRPPGWRSGRG